MVSILHSDEPSEDGTAEKPEEVKKEVHGFKNLSMCTIMYFLF